MKQGSSFEVKSHEPVLDLAVAHALNAEVVCAGRILLVDDDPDIASFTKINLVLEGFDVAVAHDGESALKIARDIQPDLVLLDVMMPGMDGYAVCRELRQDARTAHAAIIMLTAKSLSAEKVLGLTAGADDYISKPFDPVELVARVRSALRRTHQMRDVSPLTGLPGNFQISHELERLLAVEDPHFALIYADLDDFKAYNDYYGFMRGDAAIKATGRVLYDALCGTGGEPLFIGHIGGDDFVLISDPDIAETIAQRVIESFDAQVPELYDVLDRERGYIESKDRQGRALRFGFMTISLGIASTARRDLSSHIEASSVASDMKTLAKQVPGSAFKVDRRTS